MLLANEELVMADRAGDVATNEKIIAALCLVRSSPRHGSRYSDRHDAAFDIGASRSTRTTFPDDPAFRSE
jgi:hypothetical protein